jgi:hypothetical protein
MDILERVNDGYSNKDIRTVDFLVSIVIFYLKEDSNKIIISAHKIIYTIINYRFLSILYYFR